MAASRSSKKSNPITTPVTVTIPTPAPAPSQIPQRSELKGSGTTSPAAATTQRIITHEQIERRAYEIYASRGYAQGDQVADWHEAERQLKAGL